MFWLWGVVLFIFLSLLVFGYFLDKKTDRYKLISDKKTQEGQEAIKDKTQKHNPPNINHTDHW